MSPVFEYAAQDRTGRITQGRRAARSKDELISALRARGLTATRVEEAATDQARSSPRASLFSGRIKLRHLSMFCRQFATLIGAGVSLVRCLDVLDQQTESMRLKEVIRDIQREVEGGSTLSRAMGRFPRVFSALAVGLIRAGEVGGVLDETLDRLAQFLEKDMALRRKVKSSMTYPVLVGVVGLGIMVFLATFIIPRFVALFAEIGLAVDEFPLPTLLLVRASNVITGWWWLCLLFGAVGFMAIRRVIATRTGRRYFDALRLRLPVMGSLFLKVGIARFARTLSTLLGSGVPILQAMETTAGAVDNTVLADAILAARSSVREGQSISEPLANSGMFPPMVVQMIAIGEETGQLDGMLSRVADFYEEEVDAAVAGLTSALEPVMIVGLGFMVGFVVISMFLPLVRLIDVFSQ